MARLDVYPRSDGKPGFLLDVQSDVLSGLETRAVVLLMPRAAAPEPIRELNPVVDINAAEYVLLPQAIATVSAKNLRRRIASLDDHHDAVTRALDILLVGF